MEDLQNSTQSSTHSLLRAQAAQSSGNAYLYILIVISFYGVFLCGIMLVHQKLTSICKGYTCIGSGTQHKKTMAVNTVWRCIHIVT
uniref:Uncharacterized protein n=1 Tax=Hippocampus comes TaxID=109280 RepID=A0A3Q2Z2G2_HIPCM